MSDLETRLSAALSAGAAASPSAVGLADGARRRLRRRRRTRGVVGGVLAVLLVAVPVGVVVRDGSGSSPDDAVVVDAGVVDGWRTMAYDGVSVDVPADWQRLDKSSCEWDFVQLGPPGADPCEQEEGVSFYASATFDAKHRPGLRGGTGYVGAGAWAVYVSGVDPDVAWRVLGSAREERATVPNLSYGSTSVAQDGLKATVPVDQAGWSVRFVDRPAPRYPEVLPGEDGWVGRAGRGDATVLVDAPTQALAELIAGSVTRSDSGPRTPYIPRTETWGDITVDVPADWASGAVCGSSGPPAVEAPGDGPGGAGPCGTQPMGLGVRFFWSGLSDFIIPILEARGTAVQVDDDFPEGQFPDGAWIAWDSVDGDDAVFVVTESREITQQVIDSVRAAGVEATDEWHTESWSGLSVEVPASWKLGHRSAWCTRGAATRGTVERPGQLDNQPRCPRPQFGFGLTFGPAGAFDPVYESGHVWQYERGDVEMYVEGSWLGFWYDEDRVVQVNAGDRATVQRILDSLQMAD